MEKSKFFGIFRREHPGTISKGFLRIFSKDIYANQRGFFKYIFLEDFEVNNQILFKNILWKTFGQLKVEFWSFFREVGFLKSVFLRKFFLEGHSAQRCWIFKECFLEDIWENKKGRKDILGINFLGNIFKDIFWGYVGKLIIFFRIFFKGYVGWSIRIFEVYLKKIF